MKRIEDFIAVCPELKDVPYSVLYAVVWHLKINGYLKDNV